MFKKCCDNNPKLIKYVYYDSLMTKHVGWKYICSVCKKESQGCSTMSGNNILESECRMYAKRNWNNMIEKESIE